MAAVSQHSPDDLIDLAYKGVLGRGADPAGLATWRERLARVGPEAMIQSLVNSAEFQRRFLHRRVQEGGLDAAKAICGLLVHFQIAKVLHPARLDLVRNVVPAGERVLDLGGASGKPQGALLEMGYRHARHLTIIDLPLDTRMKAGPDVRTSLTHEGTEVRYEYHSMADLSRYPSESFDLVWSGQTFEHITEQEGADLFPQVRRVLRRGGIFALDTPNRTITRLTVGDGSGSMPNTRSSTASRTSCSGSPDAQWS
jgi:SAM-dependent methyltransferase